MNRRSRFWRRCAFSSLALIAAANASAGIVLYQDDNFRGKSFEASGPVSNMLKVFGDVASSAVVTGEDWEICVDTNFGGRCEPLRPGRYATLRTISMNDMVSSVRPVRGGWNGGGNGGGGDDIVLYQDDNFRGSFFASGDEVQDLASSGFNDRTSSVIVNNGTWRVCGDANFRGSCQTLAPGRYATLRSVQLNDMVSSIQRVRGGDGGRPGRDGGLTMYADDNYRGNSYAVNGEIGNLKSANFNDLASSVEVNGGQWQLCSDANFRGNCQTVQRGRYPSLRSIGLNDSVTSVRRVDSGSGPGNSWGSGDYKDVPQVITGRNGGQVIVNDECTVNYNPQGRRSNAGRGCDANEIMRADRAMDAYRREQGW